MIPERRKSPAETKLDAFFVDLAAIAGPAAEDVSRALGAHLADGLGELSPAAEAAWQQVRSLLKMRSSGRLTAEALAPLRSWPGARIEVLLTALHDLHDILQRESNARWEADIREQVAKTYL